MQYECDAKELKNALGAIISLSKKMPRELGKQDAGIAFLCEDVDKYRLVSCYDWFSATVELPSMMKIGSNPGLSPRCNGIVTKDMLIGISDDSELLSIVTKISDVKEPIVFDYNREASLFKLKAPGKGEYSFDTAIPNKIISSYVSESQNRQPVATMDAGTFESFCTTLSSLSKMVSVSAINPAFENVVITSFPDDGKNIALSGNSEVDGVSVIYDLGIKSSKDICALIPKKLAEGLKGFASSMGIDGTVEISAVLDDNNHAKSLLFAANGFELGIACKVDMFPFSSISNIAGLVDSMACQFNMETKEMKKVLDRTSVLAKKSPLTSVKASDGGGVSFIQHNDGSIHSSVASESMNAQTVLKFPDDLAEIKTVVRTDMLKKTFGFFSKTSSLQLGILRKADGSNGHLSLSCAPDKNGETITAVLSGVKVR